MPNNCDFVKFVNPTEFLRGFQMVPSRNILLFAVPIALSSVCVYVWQMRRRRVNAERQSNLHIVLVENAERWDEVERLMRASMDKFRVVGLDCEWTNRSDGVGQVALLQLASNNGVCALIRLPNFRHNIPDSLVALLRDERILKVGVGIHNDAAKLFKDYGIKTRGYLDLAWMASRDAGATGLGLQALASRYLGMAISKSLDIRCSDWDAEILTEEQKDYAANDAFVAVRIFSVLLRSKITFLHSLYFWKTRWSDLYPELYQWTQVPFKHHQSRISENGRATAAPSSKCVPAKGTKYSHSTRKRPLYDNCILQAPDGQTLCTCDFRKVKWYVEKGLGDLVSDSPMAVRLRFEPSGRPDDDDYYLQPKDNCCVVCGTTEPSIRKNIVPQEYRRYFPTNLKSHKCHDIVPLCRTCHQLSDFHDHNFKLKLVEEFDAPLGAAANSRIEENQELRRVQSAARAMSIDTIPAERKRHLETIICQHYGAANLTEEIVKDALNLQTKFENKDYVPHGLKVVNRLIEMDRITQFEKQWRQHFLDVMEPAFMPKFWSVDHRH